MTNLALVVLVWLIAAAATFWILFPAVMFALGRSRLHTEVNDDPTGAEPRGKEPDYAQKVEQLRALGFRPAGTTVETARFASPLQWSWRSGGERWFVSEDRKTYVVVYRVPGTRVLRTTALTAFAGGGLVQTASPGLGATLESSENYRRVELGKTDPAGLLARHREAVAELCTERALATKAATLREIVDEDTAISRRLLSKSKHGLMGFGLIGSMFVMPVVFVVFGHGEISRQAPPLFLGISVCVFALLYAALRFAVIPSRVPRLLRFVPMLAFMMGPLLMLPVVNARDRVRREITAAVDQVGSGADPAAQARNADKVIQLGPKACGYLLRRLATPETSPETKHALHDVLVRLRGGDLGEAPEAWRAWCAEARR